MTEPAPTPPASLAPHLALDRELVAAADGILVLATLEWPAHVLEDFLAGWRRGRVALPEVEPRRPDHRARLEALEGIMRRADRGHPLGDLVWKTAWSYATAVRMLDAAGTADLTARSVELYGRPDVRPEGQEHRDLDAAEHFLRVTTELLGACRVPEPAADLEAPEFARRVAERVDAFLGPGVVAVDIAPDLASKASAGSRRVRVRQGARFTALEVDQLVEHEVHVHTATLLNGKAQPALDVLGLGTPRTTRTQEGLATFAELVTTTMDLARLRRIALRVRAVQMGLEGADFVDVFRMFLAEGQSEEESAYSAMRIFRGGDPRGGAVFTKDGVYVGGLLEVHGFLQVAVRDGRLDLIRTLFAGRLTQGDAVSLAPLMEAGVLEPPRYLPPWAQDLRRLSALLAYSGFVGRLGIDHLRPETALDREERRIAGSPAEEAVGGRGPETPGPVGG